MALTAAQWQAFWQVHGVENDVHSHIGDDYRVQFNPQNFELELTIDGELPSFQPLPYSAVEKDYYQKTRPSTNSVVPGPFAELAKGQNKFQLWAGLPYVAEDELPPQDWTESASKD